MTITILDGALGQELVHRAGGAPTPYWSTSVMLKKPDLVGELHSDYFNAGAVIATTNTYTLLPDRIKGSRFEDHFEDLLITAMNQATGARDAHGSGRVAGSLGPLGASYRTDFRHSVDDACALYKPVIETLNAGVDFFVVETISSIAQAENIIAALSRFTEKPAWLCFSVDDEDGSRLRSGEPLEDILPLVMAAQIEAVLINCSRPEVIKDALHVIAGAGKPFGAYANGFTKISDAFLADKPTVDALEARRDLGPMEYADYAQTWVDAGATLIGGCCEVGPAHIAELKRRFG